jgi:hypothetical protein
VFLQEHPKIRPVPAWLKAFSLERDHYRHAVAMLGPDLIETRRVWNGLTLGHL